MKGNCYQRWGKRVLDLVVSGILLVLLAPIQAFTAALVGLTSGRPILFKQERVGRHGQVFELAKFRTMVTNAHEISGGYPSESLVTPVGKVLRKTSLDELPQLWSIFRGDMSLVGPRPALEDQVLRYTPEQRRRLEARPGVTGLAQIRYRNAAPWSVRIESDVEYIDNQSLGQDLFILLRTIPAVLFGSGVQTGQTADQVDDLGEVRSE